MGIVCRMYVGGITPMKTPTRTFDITMIIDRSLFPNRNSAMREAERYARQGVTGDNVISVRAKSARVENLGPSKWAVVIEMTKGETEADG